MQKILLVENSVTDAICVRRALKALNVLNPVTYFSEGADAMASLGEMEQKAASDPSVVPSILLLDLKLAGAFEILEHLHRRSAFSEMLKIVMAPLSEVASIRKAYRLGARTLLSKPINVADLRQPIKRHPSHWDLKKSSPSTPVPLPVT
jgi:CheY-like chemotaxis protein